MHQIHQIYLDIKIIIEGVFIMGRQLYRPTRNRVIAGVCGGFADYFNIDPAIIRILCIILALTGTGFLAYILAWIIMPDERNLGTSNGSTWDNGTSGGFGSTGGFDGGASEKDNWDRPVGAKYDSEKNKFIIGAGLVGFGVLLLIRQLIPDFGPKFFVPMLLVIIGGAIIYKGRHKYNG